MKGVALGAVLVCVGGIALAAAGLIGLGAPVMDVVWGVLFAVGFVAAVVGGVGIIVTAGD